jgi:hypothetical protein
VMNELYTHAMRKTDLRGSGNVLLTRSIVGLFNDALSSLELKRIYI